MITYKITEKGLYVSVCAYFFYLNQQWLLVFRVDSHQTPSVDSISSISKENKSGSEERVSKPFDSREKNKNKENLPRGHHKNSIVQSNENETNRRFTTPVNRWVK